MSRLALVLSAGGSRGAYEAGVLCYIRSSLPKHIRLKNFDIHTGTSVGALNTVGWVANAHQPEIQGEKLQNWWLSIRQEDIYRRDLYAVARFLKITISGILRNFLTIKPENIPNRKGPHFVSFLDASPLKEFLKREVSWPQLNKNIKDGPVDAVAINTTNFKHGYNELFVQKKNEVDYRGGYLWREGPLKMEHVLASTALPTLFPTVKIDNDYYGDGGIRLFTPLSPAIHLGADRLLVLGLRRRPKWENNLEEEGLNFKHHPSLSEQLGRLLNGLFLDRVRFDVEQLKRINTIIEAGEKVYGPTFLDNICREIYNSDCFSPNGDRKLKKIRCLEILPSEYVNNIFLRWYKKSKKLNFTKFEEMMVRLLDIDPITGSDLLSFLVFNPDYLRELFDLGYEDAKSHRDELIDIME